MIPNKKKTDNIWPTSRNSTDLQKLAQKENFALFQLAGVLGQVSSYQFDFIKDKQIQKEIEEIRSSLKLIQTHIKCIQSDRKRARKAGKK
jgi:hypothetical protein